MFTQVRSQLIAELTEIESAGTKKSEVEITSAQGAHITIDGKPFLNFCSNNYLGLANHPEVIEAGREALKLTAPGRF